MEFLADETVHRITRGVGQCSVASFSASFPLLFINSLIPLADTLEPHLSQRRLFNGNKILWPKYLHEPCSQKEKELSLKATQLHYSVSHDCLQERH